jgi:SAM-dependent methyltransferase
MVQVEWDARLSTPGSPVCGPDWLALREPADAAARSVELARLVGEPQVVRDLGCGTGSMARWLGPRIPEARWILHDRDPALLRIAAAHGTTVEGDLADLADLDGTDLVTASALLDLLTITELERLAALTVAAGARALITLSVTGGARLHPADPLDVRIAAAFDAHQCRDGLLGPDAPRAAAGAFRGLGREVLLRPSPWLLSAGPLLEEWLRGWIGAAVEHDPALAEVAGDYLRRRLGEPELRAMVPHADLLVR